jgi:hypothetical protein
MSRLLYLLLLSPLPALAAEPAAEPTAVAPPVFDAQGRVIGQPLSDRVVDYQIDARLDPATRTLTGRETITWRNRSAEPQATLWFHLYWNAFKNDRSTFHRDSKQMGGVRDEEASGSEYPKRKKEDWGYSDVKAVKVKDGPDLLSTLRFEHPDDDNADDQTVFTVTLPKPVPAGGSVTLELSWEARVPKIVMRAGHEKGFYLMGQWFPKLGVLEIPPERGVTKAAWNCHQYHAATEFYADFGTYDVRLTVPSAMKVGATGLRVEQKANADGTVTHRYHQDDVHDFAWTAYERFEVLEDVFRSPGLPEVKVTVLVDPRHRRSAPQLMAASKASLEHFGRWWYPFPYPHLTVVAPPTDAIAAGGMEYPTFITSVGREEPGEPRDFAVWQTTVHEIGHNYWQGIMASNEFEEAWMDEGINSYGTFKVSMAEGIQLRPEDLLPQPLRGLLGPIIKSDADERQRMRGISRPRWDSPMQLSGWKYRTRGDYSSNVYSRAQLTLHALEQYLGEETMARVMRTYVDRWKFKHPRSEDFYAVANEVSGQDLGWFWDAFFRGTGGLDYSVSQLSCSTRVPESKAGVFDDGKGGHVLLERTPPAGKDEAGKVNRCEVQVARAGDVLLPVEVQVTFADGEKRTEHWDGQGRWQRFVYEREGKDAQVSKVEVAPRGLLALDATPGNNTRNKSFSGHVPAALFGWMTYVGQFLATLASILS